MRRFGLVGRSLQHSASAEYFAEKFRCEGITDAVYTLYELPDIAPLSKLLIDTPDLCGFNVTIPYKQQIIPYLDELSFEAQAVGAVNCVWRCGDRLIGYNTDVEGLRISLTELLDGELPEQALVLGTGGASQAVQYVLSELGVGYALVSRDEARGNFTYDNLPTAEITASRLIINATPVGTYPLVDEAPRIPYAYVTPDHHLLDLVYNPPLTQFLDYGRQRGAKVLNGLRMLHVQAEASWRIWNG